MISRDPRVRGLVEEILETHRTPEEVCEACPELLPEVRDRLRRFASSRPRSTRGSRRRDQQRDPSIRRTERSPRFPATKSRQSSGEAGWASSTGRGIALEPCRGPQNAASRGVRRAHETARFQRKAQVVAGLRHENIVQVYDVGDHDGCPFFTMELLEGGTLRSARGHATVGRARWPHSWSCWPRPCRWRTRPGLCIAT